MLKSFKAPMAPHVALGDVSLVGHSLAGDQEITERNRWPTVLPSQLGRALLLLGVEDRRGERERDDKHRSACWS
jgi:hypothetical protein